MEKTLEEGLAGGFGDEVVLPSDILFDNSSRGSHVLGVGLHHVVLVGVGVSLFIIISELNCFA